jgi:ferritin-like metal-binding protein YciE
VANSKRSAAQASGTQRRNSKLPVETGHDRQPSAIPVGRTKGKTGEIRQPADQGNGKRPEPSQKRKATTEPARPGDQHLTPAPVSVEEPRPAMGAVDLDRRPEGLRHESKQAEGQMKDSLPQMRQLQEELRALQQSLQEVTRQWEQAGQGSNALRQQSKQALQDFQQAEQLLATAHQHATEVSRQCHAAEGHLQATLQQAAQVREAQQHMQQELAQARRELAEAQRQLHDAHQAHARLPLALQTAAQEWHQVWEGIWRTAQALPGTEQNGLVPDAAETASAPLAGPLAENAQGRLVRQLQDAWRVEQALADFLQNMIEETTATDLRTWLEEQRRHTHEQQKALKARLEALGAELPASVGTLRQMLARLWEALRRPQDDVDKTMQNLMKGVGATHFKIAMYLLVESLAQQAGDAASAALAGQHLRSEQAASERLWRFIRPIAAAAVNTPVA